LSRHQAFEEGRHAAWLSIWTLLAIGIAEISISLINNSLVLFADGLDSLADSLIAFIVWFGITMLHRPKNKLFQFGYAKTESFASFVAAIAIVILGAFIVYNAYQRILHPIEANNSVVTMITLAAAGCISLHRAFRVRDIAKKHNLLSLKLDAKNSIKDGSASFVALASVLAGFFGVPYMDSIGSVIIAAYIFFMAYTALRESALVLVDAVKNPEMEGQIIKFVQERFGVKVERVLLRPLGSAFSAQIHVALNPTITIKEAHEILSKINAAIEERFETEETVVIPKPQTTVDNLYNGQTLNDNIL
jgi:cation diffusion facilitator family transporter